MIVFGCAWYPEHWPESRWKDDLELMRQAHMNVVRIAEFAWSRMERVEGQFDLDWLDRAITLAAEYVMQIVLGTPTAAPPAWLTQRYPETLAVLEDGRQATHGARCHYTPTSKVYLKFCRRIAEVMARRFGHNPHVIGWQIDNEYNTFSYDPETRRQFQAWLKVKFGTLEALAEHWATAYWSQDYSDWSQIPIPVKLPNGIHNPGLWLAFRQFMTDVYSNFQHVQVEAIHAKADPRQWITHNFMKWNEGFDHYELTRELDLASWDNYVPTGHLDYLENGAMHDTVRGFKRKNFWLMETQPGNVNWGSINTVLNRGEVRSLGWHAVGHGADAVCYWQWRGAPGGQEQMHGSLLAQDGKPRPVYHEVAEFGREIDKASAYFDGTSPSAHIAILQTYEDRWAINYQRHHGEFDPIQHLLSYYRPLRRSGHTIDVVHPRAPLNGYKLVIAPNLHILDAEDADHLLAYVQQGGHLVLGVRSGVKDGFNALLASRQPGPLAAALGAHVEEYYALLHPVPINGEVGEGNASIWAELLQIDSPDTNALLCYGQSNGWLDGQPAATTRRFHGGRMTYVGALLDAGLMQKVANWLLEVSGVPDAWDGLPIGVEVCQRTSPNADLFIVINHTSEAQAVPLPQPFLDLLLDEVCERTLSLPPYGVAVLKDGMGS